jgi:hypothetical protein
MFGFLFKLVNMINGWEVELVGGLLYLASVAVFFRNVTGIILLALLVVYVLSRLTKTFSFLAKLGDMWDADSSRLWPAFVALGIACLVAAAHPHGRFIVGSVFTTLDGMYFEQNY